MGFGGESFRVLTDLVGLHYTLVLEVTHVSLSAYEQAGQKMTGSPGWRDSYQKFVPHVESGRREIFNIVQ